MKVLALCMAWIFLLMVFPLYPAIIDSFSETITEPTTDLGNITTGAGESTGNITLSEDLYLDRLSVISVLTSDHGPDSPVATSYDSTTNELFIGGLAASQTRDITCTYIYDDIQDFENSREVLQMGPVALVVSHIFLVIAIPALLITVSWRRMRGR